MGRKDIITMSLEELKRVSVIDQALAKVVTQKKAAKVIGVSERQVRRLVKTVREGEDRGIIYPAGKTLQPNINSYQFGEISCNFVAKSLMPNFSLESSMTVR